ncbi:pilus assembly protein [Bordetella genomosp. 12]|uniref:Pilus assembly protein n=2 Tax=Bordetella genomosp. 12 TaxID=463035 RepID=A0A261VDN9_9BORD|nr:pilus assembly protein [Bordetella genomosp. 12]
MQARQLNLLAYIHRAQLAHQVAMAHLVTLIAWHQLGATQASRRSIGNPPAFLIARLFGPRFARAYGVSPSGSASDSYAPGALQASLQRHDAVVHRILAEVARQQWRQMTSLRDTHMQHVLQANYVSSISPPSGVPVMRVHDDTFPRLLAWQSPTEAQGLQALTQAVTRRFAFLRPRDLTWASAWIVQLRCPNSRHQLRRRGHTFLDAQGRWGASDTLSFHALRSNRWIGCYFREYPMGWATTGSTAWKLGRHYVERPLAEFSSQDYWRWYSQHSGLHPGAWRNNPLASSYAMRDRYAPPQGSGLPDVLGLSPLGLQQARARFRVSLHTSMAVSDLGHAWQVPRLSSEQAWWRARPLVRSAVAETYFAVPPGASSGTELPSLFRPYWQARLAAAPASRPGAHP